MEETNRIILFKTHSMSKKACLFSVLFFIFCQLIQAQDEKSISGKVISQSDNEPLIGVSVVQKGTTNGTITDINGNFELLITSEAIIEISYVGFKSQRLNVKPGDKHINNVSSG